MSAATVPYMCNNTTLQHLATLLSHLHACLHPSCLAHEALVTAREIWIAPTICTMYDATCQKRQSATLSSDMRHTLAARRRFLRDGVKPPLAIGDVLLEDGTQVCLYGCSK